MIDYSSINQMYLGVFSGYRLPSGGIKGILSGYHEIHLKGMATFGKALDV